MAKRQRQWARVTRDAIFNKLGRKCNVCGSTQNLEFDVIIPVGDIDDKGKEKHHRKMEWSWRMSFYRLQLDLNNLQILCDKCNGRKQNRLQLSNIHPPTTPF